MAEVGDGVVQRRVCQLLAGQSDHGLHSLLGGKGTLWGCVDACEQVGDKRRVMDGVRPEGATDAVGTLAEWAQLWHDGTGARRSPGLPSVRACGLVHEGLQMESLAPVASVQLRKLPAHSMVSMRGNQGSLRNKKKKNIRSDPLRLVCRRVDADKHADIKVDAERKQRDDHAFMARGVLRDAREENSESLVPFLMNACFHFQKPKKDYIFVARWHGQRHRAVLGETRVAVTAAEDGHVGTGDAHQTSLVHRLDSRVKERGGGAIRIQVDHGEARVVRGIGRRRCQLVRVHDIASVVFHETKK